MPAHEDAVRIRHMLDAARKALAYSQGRNREDLDSDELLALALVRLLEVIGEAAKGLSSPLRESHPDIAWSAIAGTRDRLIHGYFDVDLDVVWAILRSDLPTLIARLEAILPDEEG